MARRTQIEVLEEIRELLANLVAAVEDIGERIEANDPREKARTIATAEKLVDEVKEGWRTPNE